MIAIQYSCAACGKWRLKPLLETDKTDELNANTIETLLKREGWIVQRNGEHFDTYCSKECAK